jgi:ATP-binding cassette subfamily B protein
VPQEPFLFSGTIRSNIAYGRPDATDLDIERAARAVGAHDSYGGWPTATTPSVSEPAVRCRPASANCCAWRERSSSTR